jgi:hypothetical protein
MYKTVQQALAAQKVEPVIGPEILYCDDRTCQDCSVKVQERCKAALVCRRITIEGKLGGDSVVEVAVQ